MSSPIVEEGLVGSREFSAAIRRLAVSVGTFAVLAALTYLIPGADDFRPWMPGEEPPLKKVLTFSRGGSGGSSGSTENEPALSGDLAVQSLSRNLGAAVAANLGEEAGVAASVPVAGKQPGADRPAVSVDPAELEGLVERIEDPSGRALDSFFAALRETGEGRRVTRIAHWGDSTIAADDVTGTLRRRMQARFGDSGHGFMLVGKCTMPYRHRDVRTEQVGSWKHNSIIRKERRDGRYGYGGVAFNTTTGGSAWYQTAASGPIGTEVSSFELFFLKRPEGGRIMLSVDGGRPEPISTASTVVEDGFHRVKTTTSPHRFDLKTEGDVTMYGVVMERDSAGVVYDSLGIVGARASRMTNADQVHFAGQVARRAPDLMVIAFGGNESGDRQMNFAQYRDSLKKTVALFKASRPESACMLLAPLDQGEVGKRGKVGTIPTIPKIVQVQREVAAESGCAFFDTFRAMGGEGSMARWYKSKPRLGWGDYRHATPAGYEVIGNMIYKAIMASFADYLKRVESPAGNPGE